MGTPVAPQLVNAGAVARPHPAWGPEHKAMKPPHMCWEHPGQEFPGDVLAPTDFSFSKSRCLHQCPLEGRQCPFPAT